MADKKLSVTKRILRDQRILLAIVIVLIEMCIRDRGPVVRCG